MSAAFGGVSPITRELHTYVASKLRETYVPPKNNALNLARSLAEAWRTYIDTHHVLEAVLCFVVEDKVYNIYDQRQIERLLDDEFGVPAHQIVRKSNKDFVTARMADNGALMINDQEVAVFYMRTWYDPKQILTEELWEARETIERSRSIKCPNLAWHLVGEWI